MAYPVASEDHLRALERGSRDADLDRRRSRMITATKGPRTLGHRPSIDVLSQQDVDRIHEATLQVLEDTGVNVRSGRVLKLLAEAGASVDFDQDIVRFTPVMVEQALAAAPRTYLMAARDPAFDMMLDRSRGYACVEGGLAEIVDLDTGRPRKATYQDLVDATRVADAIDEVTYLWPCTAISDVPPQDQAVHQTYVQLANSVKHVVAMTTYNARDARAVLEMGGVVAGGSEALSARPVVSSFACSISPLTWDGQPIEAALVFAEAGVPCGITAMPVSTAGAPTTLAGHLVVANADVLSGITILQTLFPGAPTYYNPFNAEMNLLTGNLKAAWGPEPVLFNFAAAQMGRRYGLPVSLGINGTGSKTQDWQAGVQGALLLMGILGCGDIDLLACTGGIDSSRVFSFEQVLLDCELFEIASLMLEGFPTDDEHLAVSVIGEVGPGGHYLGARHTRKHMRETWQAKFFSSATWDEWEHDGRREPKDRARERARELIKTHQPTPLPEDVDRELRSIVDAFTREEVGP
ncbi:MAG: trimethylamine methyltransferase family protein [Actinomycetes bacterium]